MHPAVGDDAGACIAGKYSNGIAADGAAVAEGVGEAQVLVTEEGAVIVCTGGDSPAVQERVLRAACTACGFPSNQVYIAKLIT